MEDNESGAILSATEELILAVLEPYAGVRQKVLLTDDEPGQRAFYESLGYRESRDHGAGSLRAFVRFDG